MALYRDYGLRLCSHTPLQRTCCNLPTFIVPDQLVHRPITCRPLQIAKGLGGIVPVQQRVGGLVLGFLGLGAALTRLLRGLMLGLAHRTLFPLDCLTPSAPYPDHREMTAPQSSCTEVP